jgi:hypothetical protein
MPMMTRAYQVTDRPGATLFIGIPSGRNRPALWMTYHKTGEAQVILAQFHGEAEATVVANFLDAMVGQIQRVIDFLADGDASHG